jgi:hypothetical protein
MSDVPSSLHIVTDEPFRGVEPTRHDDLYPAQQPGRRDYWPTFLLPAESCWRGRHAREAAVIIGRWRGAGWQVFDADPRAGRHIRDWISSAISGHDCPVDASDAALAGSGVCS